MIRHVLVAFSTVFVTNAQELTLDDPIEKWFPEMELNEEERMVEQAWKDEPDATKKQMNVGSVIDIYNKKVKDLSPERTLEYNEFQAKKSTSMYGEETGNAMRCEGQYKHANKWSEPFIWDKFGFEDLGGALYLDMDRYMKYVHNQPEKPWLLMMVKSPYSSSDSHYQTFEVVMHRIYCACKHLNINLGIVDMGVSEMIKESFYYKDGDYGFGVPYYVYLQGGKAVHLEQRLWQMQPLVEALNKAKIGEGHQVESRRAPRNSVNIFWEYAQREVGHKFIKMTMFPLLEFLEKDMEHDMFKLYAKWFSARDNGEKGAGFHVFMFFIFPLFFLSLFILHCILRCICRCLCGKKVKVE